MIKLAKPRVYKPPTPAQKKQRILAWKLRMVMRTRGNLYPREHYLPPEITARLHIVYSDLKVIEQMIRDELKRKDVKSND